jgi:MFS transporter, DHA1 family, tetracycline resistance protein
MSDASQATPAARGRVPLAPVLLVEFIGTLGFSIVLPFLVFLVTRLGGNALVYGLLGATYPVFQFVGAPVLGRWSDRLGRKRVLLLSQGGTFASWLVFCGALALPVRELATVHSALLGDFTLTLPLAVLFGARALDGLTGGNISVANAYVADISTEAERSRNFGRMGVAANLGLIAGPGLAAALGATAWGELLPVLAATGISGVALALIAWRLPESSPCGQPSPSLRNRAAGTFGQEPLDCLRASQAAAGGTRAALARPGVAFLLALNFVILLAFNVFYTAFPAHALADLHWNVTETGLFFGVLSLLLVGVEGPLLGRLARRVPEPWLVVGGCAVLGLNFLLMQSQRTEVVYLGAALFALGNGVMWPSLVSIVAATGGERLQGAVQGLVGGAGSLAAIVGLIGGGLAFGLLGAGAFVAAAGLAFAAAALALWLLRAPRPPRAGAVAG